MTFEAAFEGGLEKTALIGAVLRGLGKTMWRHKKLTAGVGFTGMDAGFSINRNLRAPTRQPLRGMMASAPPIQRPVF